MVDMAAMIAMMVLMVTVTVTVMVMVSDGDGITYVFNRSCFACDFFVNTIVTVVCMSTSVSVSVSE